MQRDQLVFSLQNYMLKHAELQMVEVLSMAPEALNLSTQTQISKLAMLPMRMATILEWQFVSSIVQRGKCLAKIDPVHHTPKGIFCAMYWAEFDETILPKGRS